MQRQTKQQHIACFNACCMQSVPGVDQCRTEVVDVAAGSCNVLALKRDGSVWAFGTA